MPPRRTAVRGAARTRSASRAVPGVPRTNRSRPYLRPGIILANIAEALEDWNVQKLTLPNVTENEEWRTTMREQIVTDVLMQETFQLHADGRPTGTNRSARNMTSIATRFLVFNSPLVIHAFHLYGESIFMTQGLLMDITTGANRAGQNAGIQRNPLNINRLESRIPCWPSWRRIFAEGSQRARDNPRNGEYYHYGYDPACRGVLQMIIVHVTGTLGMVLNSLDANAKENGTTKKHAKTILAGIKPIYNEQAEDDGTVRTFTYETSMASMDEFRTNVWNSIIEAVLHVAKQYFEDAMMAAPEADRRRVGGRGGIETAPQPHKLYLRRHDQRWTSPMELLRHFFTTDQHAVNFWGDILGTVFQFVLRDGNGLFIEFTEPQRFEFNYEPVCRRILRTMYDLIFTSAVANRAIFTDNINANRAEFHHLYNEWEETILDNIRARPIRHMEQPEIDNAVASEQVGLVTREIQPVTGSEEIVTDHGTAPPEPPSPSVHDLNDETVDITAALGTHRDEEIQRGQQNNDQPGTEGVSILVVEEPPADALDDAGKCKCCRIDWSKLNGRVQILRCPPSINSSIMQSAMENAVTAAGTALRTDLAARANQNGQQGNDEVQTQEVQVSLPENGEGSQEAQLDVQVLRHLTRIPIQLLMHEQGGAALNTAQAAARAVGYAPDVLNSIFNALLAGTRRRLITAQNGNQNGEPQITPPEPPPAPPAEVNVRLSETTVQNGEQGENGTTRVTLQVNKTAVQPLIPDTVLDGVLDTVGLGSVNRNNDPSFSSLQAPQPNVPEIGEEEEDNDVQHDTDEAHSESFMEQSIMVSANYTVEGISVFEPKLDASYLLIHWYKTKRFVHTTLDRSLNWADKHLRCESGPLSNTRDRSQQDACTFNSLDEYCGNILLLSIFEFYDTIMECLNNAKMWDSAAWLTRSVSFEGERDHLGGTLIRLVLDGPNRPVITAYSFAVAHVMVERLVANVDGAVETVLHRFSRKLVYIYSVERRNETPEDEADVVSAFVLTWAQPDQMELDEQARVHEEADRARREGRDNNIRYQIALSSTKYAGPSAKSMTYCKSLKKLPSIVVSRLLGSAPERVYEQSYPFQNHQRVAENTLSAFVNREIADENIRMLMRLLMRFQTGVVPDLNAGHYLTQAQYPTVLQPTQLACCTQALNIIEENMNIAEEKKYKSPFYVIRGPAGTGKTSTLLNIISMVLSRKNVVNKIVDIYDAIEHYKAPDQHFQPVLQPGVPPENQIRILIVTETNNSLCEMENGLMEGIILMPQDNSLRRIIPLYSKVAMKHEEKYRRDLTVQRQYEVPAQFDEKYTGTITMTTFGSLPKAFTGRQRSEFRTKSKLPQYDIAIIDEASQADLRRLQWLISHLYEDGITKRIPTTIIAGDDKQQQPSSNIVESKYTTLARRNIISHFINRNNVNQNGQLERRPLCPWIMLNVQFRMHPLISDLSNSVARRFVYDDLSTTRIVDHIHYGRTLQETSYNFEAPSNLNSYEFRPGVHLAFPIVAVSPYSSNIPIRSARVPPNHAPYTSFVEAIAVVRIIEYLFIHSTFNPEDIMVTSPYTNQVTLIRKLLNARERERRRGPQYRNINDTLKSMRLVNVITVGSVQSSESRCVILSPTRHSRMASNNNSNSIGIAGFIETVYVAITRARDQLIIVGDMKYLRNFSPWNNVDVYLNARNYRNSLGRRDVARTDAFLSGQQDEP